MDTAQLALSAALAFGTLALVLVTLYYACQTRNTVRAMREQTQQTVDEMKAQTDAMREQTQETITEMKAQTGAIREQGGPHLVVRLVANNDPHLFGWEVSNEGGRTAFDVAFDVTSEGDLELTDGTSIQIGGALSRYEAASLQTRDPQTIPILRTMSKVLRDRSKANDGWKLIYEVKYRDGVTTINRSGTIAWQDLRRALRKYDG